MFEDLEKGQSLKDLILELLRSEPASISQLGRKLKEAYNIDLHRLALAGYLRAMTDLGVLDEKEIPPSKVYQVRPTQTPPTLYDAIARRIRDTAVADADATRLYVQVLHDLFHRPIFREELRRAGFGSIGGLIEASSEERQTARRVFSKASFKLPFNDPAYLPPPGATDEAHRLRDAARGVLAAVLRHEFRAANLAQTTKQATLGGTE